MKRSTTVLVLFCIVLGLTILITAASCSSNPTIQDYPNNTWLTPTDSIENEWPYNWDTASYKRVISYVNGEATSLDMNITVHFNEEFIEFQNTEIKEANVIYVGIWENKYTFLIDNDGGSININLNKHNIVIKYPGTTKEIYTQ